MYNLNFKSIKLHKRQYYVNYFRVLMVKRIAESTKVDKLKKKRKIMNTILLLKQMFYLYFK